jgi:2-keto-3-deoxy-L-rhamnonate aldolase RhmA
MKRLSACLLSIVFVSAAFAGEPPKPAENPLKKLLREGKPVIGMTVSVPSADVALQAARLGFDFIWIEMEHAPITLESARNMVLATQGTGLMPLIRVPVNEIWTAKRALDCGAMGVVFPFTSTPELARQAVAACKYPPVGRRGAGAGLASLRWPAPGGYANFADENALVITIIEEKRAVDQIDAILDTPGIDVVFIGTNDLSYSYGDRGRQTPQVKEAIAKIVAAAKKRNLPVGRPAGAADVKTYMAEGFSFFQGPSEISLIGAGARSVLEAVGKSAPDPATRPLY